MNNISEQLQTELPMWLKVVAIIIVVAGLSALAAIEISGAQNINWLSFLLLALLYIPIQIITEGILSAYWESPKWIIKTIPIIFLACFYVAVLTLR